jgi:hypothetical protein
MIQVHVNEKRKKNKPPKSVISTKISDIQQLSIDPLYQMRVKYRAYGSSALMTRNAFS